MCTHNPLPPRPPASSSHPPRRDSLIVNQSKCHLIVCIPAEIFKGHVEFFHLPPPCPRHDSKTHANLGGGFPPRCWCGGGGGGKWGNLEGGEGTTQQRGQDRRWCPNPSVIVVVTAITYVLRTRCLCTRTGLQMLILSPQF